MAKNVCVIGTALTNVRGRISYISSPKKQEHLEAYVDNMPKGGWLELSKYSRHQAALYHPDKKVCEARELIVMLPNDLAGFEPQKLAIVLRNEFSKEHQVPCAVAIHWNKKKNNYHAHLVFSERAIYREKQGESIATRNTYFDANGKRSTKKDCLDELGNLKSGCRLVKKGEALSEGSRFGAKKNVFAQEEWMRGEKERIANFFNLNSREEWKVYDWKKDPHFPYIRIVTGDPEKLNAWRKRENEWRRHFNENIDELIASGEITKEQAVNMKLKAMENRKRLRKEKAESKLRWMKYYDQRQERREAEWNYFRNLKKKSTFGLVVELALVIAGVDVVKLQSGVDKAERPTSRTIKAYQDERIQRMVNEVYAAAEQRGKDIDVLVGSADERKKNEVPKTSNKDELTL